MAVLETQVHQIQSKNILLKVELASQHINNLRGSTPRRAKSPQLGLPMKPSLAALDVQRVPFTLKPLACLLGANTSFDQATAMRNNGAITFKQWRWYVLLWTWKTARFSNIENAAKKQDKCYASLGNKGLQQRSDRMRRLQKKLWDHFFSDYFLSNDPQSV